MEVYQCHHQLNGTHPWRKLASEDDDDLGKLECQCPRTSIEQKVLGLSVPVFILSCALLVVTAALIIASGLLASKLAHLEQSIPSLALAAINTTTSNPNLNTNPSTNTTSPAQTALSALAPPTVLVSGWTYLGCYYDSEVRILPDASTTASNMTNGVCGAFCSASARDAASKPRHFGTQHGGQCFCGSVTEAVLASKVAPQWMCNYQCRGRWGMSENCGGNWVVSLWERDGS